MDREKVAREYSPLALAYLGDGVYELLVRDHLLRQGNCQSSKLHERARQFVSCGAQAAFLEALLPELTEDEQEVVRRGRNAKSRTKPKNAEHGTYHAATGFEALWGYLHLSGAEERKEEIFDKILQLCPH